MMLLMGMQEESKGLFTSYHVSNNVFMYFSQKPHGLFYYLHFTKEASEI